MMFSAFEVTDLYYGGQSLIKTTQTCRRTDEPYFYVAALLSALQVTVFYSAARILIKTMHEV